MKRFFLLAICAMALASGCQKQETEEFPTFYACAEMNGDAKTALVGSSIHWEDGDLVKVYGDCGYAQYRVTPEADPTSAMMSYNSVTSGNMFGFLPYRIVYPYSLALDGSGNNNVLRVSLPSIQQSVSGELTKNFPMYAESMVHNVVFKNLCGVLRIHLQYPNKNIASIQVSANEALCGTYTINNSGANPILENPIDAGNVLTLYLDSPQSIDEGKNFYLCMPAGTYTNLTLTFVADDNTSCTKSSSASFTVGRSQISSITIPSSGLTFETFIPEGAPLPGLFSVSATNQVRFAPGNLQYTTQGTHAVAAGGTMPGTWRFAEHQWNLVGSLSCLNISYHNNVTPGNVDGSDNAFISSSYTGWIDLFGWGTSGYNNKYPYMTDYDFYNTNSLYGNGNNDISGTNYDWGEYNAISNGGNQPGLWRTLTISEWRHLYSGRTNYSQLFGYATVCGIHCVIFLPDAWVLPIGCSFTPSSRLNVNWNDNVYSFAQWQLMERAGAVALPAAGSRGTTSMHQVGSAGYYWSSTHGYYSYTDDDAEIYIYGINGAYYFFFDEDEEDPYLPNAELQCVGRSVRLVQDNS